MDIGTGYIGGGARFDWAAALDKSEFEAERKQYYRKWIHAFLEFCSGRGRSADSWSADLFVRMEAPKHRDEIWQIGQALQWFLTQPQPTRLTLDISDTRAQPIEAVKSINSIRSEERVARSSHDCAQNTPVASPAWEESLIQACREHHFLWRTEETYRRWVNLLARFIKPVSPLTCTPADIERFLSYLATARRVSPSTQRQALNALVFFYETALKKTLGDIQFTRCAPKRRVPTVLSVEECKALLQALDGTSRLMAALMYGSGIRLIELLRLRVQDLDLDRSQLRVRAGKGDRDRATVLPESLHPLLVKHLKKLRELWAEDRQAGLPGVWLPESLARKYPNAGVSWPWQWLFP